MTGRGRRVAVWARRPRPGRSAAKFEFAVKPASEHPRRQRSIGTAEPGRGIRAARVEAVETV
jgi:hypothetical protein